MAIDIAVKVKRLQSLQRRVERELKRLMAMCSHPKTHFYYGGCAGEWTGDVCSICGAPIKDKANKWHSIQETNVARL